MRILIVEDEFKIADVIASRLRNEQYIVDVYGDGEEGLDNSLTILDNSFVKEKLQSLIKTSIFIFVLLEIVIIVVSIKITSWIIKPVIETFNKQKQFIADASHELKTPIAVIMANSETLEKEPNEKKFLKRLEIRFLRDFIEQMSLEIGRIIDMV